jgi:predicted transcriptional regulator
MTLSRITRKRKQLISSLLGTEPMCIYQLAKALGRPYRRVHDCVKDLAAGGQVTLRSTTRNNRRATLVISNDPYYQRLLRLDDMYLTFAELRS